MATSQPDGTPRIGQTASVWALLVIAPSCVLLLIAQPRPVVVTQQPFLQLDPVAVRRVMGADRALVARVGPTPEQKQLEALVAEDTLIQNEIAEAEDSFKKRRRALALQLGELVKQEGPDAPLAVRARAVERIEAALAGDVPEAELPGVMGSFANQLQRHGVLREGRIVAPHFVVRSFYKARWNKLFALPTDHGLEPVERAALHGWLGLRSGGLSIDNRLRALQRYAEVGGRYALEAQGILLVQASDLELAVTALTEAQLRDGGLRVGNQLLGAQVSAEMDVQEL